jgi:anti-sigma factor RsiW
MKSHDSGHVLEKIRPCLDGELSLAEADAVRSHCRTCPECAHAWEEVAALADLLPAAAGEQRERSLWPAVRARLRGRPSWFTGPRFAASASVAAAAGVLLGVLLGGMAGTERSAETGSTLPRLGSVWSDNWEPTLADVYLAALSDESE